MVGLFGFTLIFTTAALAPAHSAPSPTLTKLNVLTRVSKVSSTYYQPNQTALSMANEKTRIDKGIAPVLTITSKGTQYLQDIANKSGPGWTWVNQYVTSLQTLSAYARARNAPVYATLDHEWKVKVNQKLLTGNAANPAVYAKALANFYALVNAKTPYVTTMYWYGHFDTTKINAVGSALTVKPELFGLDPYKSSSHPDSETVTQLVSPKLTWLRGRTWYAGQPISLGDLGTNKSDANMAAFYANLRADATRMGLRFVIVFNRTDLPYVTTLTTGGFPQTVAALSKQLQAS